jgi:hypothetical protein
MMGVRFTVCRPVSFPAFSLSFFALLPPLQQVFFEDLGDGEHMSNAIVEPFKFRLAGNQWRW